MSTAEDVFYLYERNSRYYYDCNLRNSIQHCSDCLNNECYCHLKQEVKPFTIGDQDVPCNFERRCYIKPGEECPICFDKIMTKSTAFISNCGHSFHKKCISFQLSLRVSDLIINLFEKSFIISSSLFAFKYKV